MRPARAPSPALAAGLALPPGTALLRKALCAAAFLVLRSRPAATRRCLPPYPQLLPWHHPCSQFLHQVSPGSIQRQVWGDICCMLKWSSRNRLRCKARFWSSGNKMKVSLFMQRSACSPRDSNAHNFGRPLVDGLQGFQRAGIPEAEGLVGPAGDQERRLPSAASKRHSIHPAFPSRLTVFASRGGDSSEHIHCCQRG
jgi:hypothetical protein